MTRPDIHIDLHLVLLRDGCILMGERRNVEFGAGQYHVPAGRLEADETIIDGIIREAREETGMEVADLAFVAITNDLFAAEGKHYITIWMRAGRVLGEPTLASPREMTAIGWFGWDALPQPLFLPVANLVAGRSYPALALAS